MNSSTIEKIKKSDTQIEINDGKLEFFNTPPDLISELREAAIDLGRRGKRISKHLEKLEIRATAKDWKRLHMRVFNRKEWSWDPDRYKGYELLCSYLGSHQTIADALAAIKSGRDKPSAIKSHEADVSFHARLLPMTQKKLLQQAMLTSDLADLIMKLSAKNETDDRPDLGTEPSESGVNLEAPGQTEGNSDESK